MGILFIIGVYNSDDWKTFHELSGAVPILATYQEDNLVFAIIPTTDLQNDPTDKAFEEEYDHMEKDVNAIANSFRFIK